MMTAEKKAYNRRVAEETVNMTKEEKQKYILVEELTQKFENLVKDLHFELFPETYDMVGDSSEDAKMRRQGKNPMSTDYTQKVNDRRRRLRFEPLGKDGLPTDSSDTIQYCKDLIMGTVKYRPKFD